jgi:hypothetical protein
MRCVAVVRCAALACLCQELYNELVPGPNWCG